MKKIIISLFLYPTLSFAEFDAELLKIYNIDKEMIDILESKETVLKGFNSINVILNGQSLGLKNIEFENDNNFYITNDLINDFKIINNLKEGNKGDFLNLYPDSTIAYVGNNLIITIDESYEKKIKQKKLYSKGIGAFLNYSIDYEKELEVEDSFNEDVFNANLYMGINYDGFLYRNNVSYNNITNDYVFNYNYFQKNLLNDKKILKLGDLYSLNPHYGSISILGLQYKNDPDFSSTSRILVSGIVQNRTRVEIYINETEKVYEEQVSTGYYEFSNIEIPLSVNRIKIVERTETGLYTERYENVVRTSFNLTGQNDFALTVGFANNKIINDEIDSFSNQYDSWVISGFTDLQETEHSKTTISTVLGRQYYFGSIGFIKDNYDFDLLSSYSLETGFSYDDIENLHGYYGSISLNSKLTKDLNLNIYGRTESNDYKQLEYESSNLKHQYSASISMPFKYIDLVSINYSKSYYKDTEALDSINMSMTKYFNNEVSLYLDYYHDFNKDWNAGLVLSIPLKLFSDAYVSTSYYTNNEYEYYEASLSDTINDYNYNISLNRNNEKRGDKESQVYSSFSLNKEFEKTNMSSGLYYNEGLSNAYLSLDGGMAYSEGNYALTSDYVDDTFGFVKVSNYDNVTIEAGNSEIITNKGIALIPSIEPYAKNEIRIKTETLNEGETIKNGYKEIIVNYASISFFEFKTEEKNDHLIKIIDQNGKNIPQNLIIRKLNDDYVTISSFDGLIFIDKDVKVKKLKIKIKGTFCYIDLSKLKDTKEKGIKMAICKK